MAKFIQKNAKNINTSHISYKVNYSNYFHNLLKQNTNFYLWLKIYDKLLAKL